MQIKFEDVSYKYKSLNQKNVAALRHINLDLSENEMTAIIGHTGSGKSTAMQHINGLLQPTEGKMKVANLEITSKKNKKLLEIRKHIGYVFQNPNYQLFASSVLEDVMYGPTNFAVKKTEIERYSKEALELTGIQPEFYDRYPFDLSGGQMRKVAIAGVLSYHPEVLILDEPTVGLDPLATEQMLELFQKLHYEQNKQLIFITHDMEFVHKLAHRVVVFQAGEVKYDGTPHTLFMQPELLKELSLEQPLIYQLFEKVKKSKTFEIDEKMLTAKTFENIDTFANALEQWKKTRKE